jgi:hypothetical protein
MNGDKINLFGDAIGQWRENWRLAHLQSKHAEPEEFKGHALERKRTALACLAATLLLHDRATYAQAQARDKVREDFRREGMLLPGMRLSWMKDRPFAIPLDVPLVKNPYAVVRMTGV